MNANYLNKELNYEELSLSAFWWSLDGQFLLYASFNDSLVNQNTISLYSDTGDYHSDSPNVQHIPFPLVSITPRFSTRSICDRDALETVNEASLIRSALLELRCVHADFQINCDIGLCFDIKLLWYSNFKFACPT